MTADELMGAAERELRRLTDEGPDRVTLADVRGRERMDRYALATAVLSAPGWHARPPVPGVYVYAMPCATFEIDIIVPVAVSIYATTPVVGRWFGPIPPAPEAAP